MNHADTVHDVSALEAAREFLQHSSGLIVVEGILGSGRTTALRTLAEECVRGTSHPTLYGGGLASLTHIPGISLSRAVRAPLPIDDKQLVVEAVLARVRSGVLVLDDLHWADDTTRALIPQLARCMRVFVSVQTPSELSEEYLALLRDTALHWHTLTPLVQRDAVAVVERVAPTLSELQRRTVVESSGGNPLTLHTLALSATRSSGDGTSHNSTPPTHSVLTHAVLHTLSTLARPARTALALLGVLSRPAERELLGDGVQELFECHLVEHSDSGMVAPVSPYFARVAASALSDQERVALHAHLSRVVDSSSVTPLEAARHAHAAGNTEHARALAQQAYDTAEQMRQYSDVFAASAVLAALPAAAADARVRAAQAALSVGKPRTALRYLEDSEHSFEGDVVRAEAHIHLGEVLRGITLTEQLWEHHSELHQRLLTLTALGVVLASRAERAEVVEYLQRRCAAYRGSAECERAVLAAVQREPQWRTQLADAAQSRVEQSEPQWWSAWLLVTLTLEEGEVAEAEQYAARYAQCAYERGVYGWNTRFSALRLWCHAVQTRDLDAVIADGLDLLDHTLPLHAESYALAAVSLALADTGSLSHAHTRITDRSSPTLNTPVLRWVESEIAWLDYTPERVHAPHPHAHQDAPFTTALQQITTEWAHAEQELPSSHMEDSEGIHAVKLTLRGWQEMYTQDSVHTLIRAADHWHSVCVREEVRALLAAALSASACNDVASVTDVLTRAQQVAEESGLTLLRARVHKLLRHKGDLRGRSMIPQLPQQKTVFTGGVELTRREQQVLELVAAGEPTRRIATLLGVSRMTVETHVRSGMRRLGARTRTEAAAVLMRAHATEPVGGSL